MPTLNHKIIAGNWKMHTTITEAASLAQSIRDRLNGRPVRVLIAPPFTALAAVKAAVTGSSIVLCAQNMSNLESGARTGEISVLMLKDLGVESVIIGHSERRQHFFESDQLINEKIRLAVNYGLDVIFCLGETLEQRRQGLTEEVVGSQLMAGLSGIGDTDLARITVAYEPVWAIGTGQAASPTQANQVHAQIRAKAEALYSPAAAGALQIIYGGSVKADNAAELLGQTDINGVLVGAASLNSDSFTAIAKSGI